MKRYLNIYKQMPVQMKASMWFLICSFLQKGISMITTPIFTRILTTSEYGQYSVFNAWLQILTPIVCLNLYAGVYAQGIVKFEYDRNRYSSSLQGLCLTLVAVCAVIYLANYNFWNNIFSLTTIQMVAMFAIIWTTSSFSFWSMNQRTDFKYRKLVLLTLVTAILQPLVSIVFILNSGDKVSARILGVAIVQIVFYIGTFIQQMKKGKKFFHKQYWLYALKFNIPLLPHYLSMNVLSSSDRIMISHMVGDGAAGIYNLAYSVSLLMTMFNTALLQTIEPWIYRKLKENKIQDLAYIAYPCFIVIAALNVLLIMFAPEVIAVFAPNTYQEAIWTIPSVALSVFFTFLYTFFATFEFYYEKTYYIAGATVGGALLNIGLNYICINRFGYIAAGYTTLFSYILFAILHYYFMRKICKEYINNVCPYNAKFIIAIGGGGIVAGFSIMLTYRNIIIRYTVIVLIALIIFMIKKKIISDSNMLINIKWRRI